MKKSPTAPPKPTKRPHKIKKNGDTRVDEYFWMRERESKEVIDYLKNENAYTEHVLQDTKELQNKIIAEMRARIKEDDDSAPIKRGPYSYFSRYTKGAEYPVFLRRPSDKKEEILLNVNELAKGHKYFDVGSVVASPDHKVLVYAVDTVGRRFYNLHFKDLVAGRAVDFKIENTVGNVVWANDNRTVFYAKQDPVTLRSYQIYKVTLPQNLNEKATQKPELVYEEKDEQFNVGVRRDLAQKELHIHVESTTSSEIWVISADNPNRPPQVFLKREKNHEYSVYDGGDRYFIHTNFKAKNFRLVETSKDQTNKKYWKDVFQHNPQIYLEQVVILKDHIILETRKNGLTELAHTPRKKYKFSRLKFPEATYMSSLGAHAEYETHLFRYEYESLTQPETTYDYDLVNNRSLVVKALEVPTYKSADYESKRIFATAKDGTRIPISIVYKKALFQKGKNPIYIYGYGSYGLSTDAYFDSSVVSLLDRGFVFAIAHIRGGSEMGRAWYENGKMLKKKNTFTDFISCTEFLIQKGFADKNRVYAWGGSAGGLLIGAVINMRPDLYRAVVAAVPFVDVLTTMLDDSIPLTTSEYEEWGNPNQKKYYKYIKSYSPYDNVKKTKYPHVLAPTGFHDSQVQYWEPAKWIARLRDHNQSDSLILFKADMDAGHSGTTGRFQTLKERALDYAFFLKIDGQTK